MAAAIAVPVIGALGLTGATVMGSIAIGAIYVASYAVVGAAIGALSSAVLGGDIGKGALYGAIGGAVMGGFTLATTPGMTSSLAAGGQSMMNSGFSAGMASFESHITAYDSVANGVMVGGGESSVSNGLMGSLGKMDKSTGGLLGETGKGLGSSLALGGINAYMEGSAAEEAAQRAEEEAEKARQFTAEQNAKELESRERIAAISAASRPDHSLEVARLNNAAAMERQKEQQAHDRALRDADRSDLLADRQYFSDSVVGASKAFAMKTARVKSYLDAPEWLQPRASTVASKSASTTYNTQQQAPSPSQAPGYQQQILPVPA